MQAFLHYRASPLEMPKDNKKYIDFTQIDGLL